MEYLELINDVKNVHYRAQISCVDWAAVEFLSSWRSEPIQSMLHLNLVLINACNSVFCAKLVLFKQFQAITR